MANKPRVFLSHSKKDKEFIERIAQDLRKCRIDAWYDDWEIPPGKSLRKKIFEEGISDCDAFFVYLTQNSIDSNWVSRELDAAFIEQSKEKNTEILTFIGSSDLIKKLPSEIAALKCPTINDENYEEGFRNLITAVYEAKINAILKERNLESENKILHSELELEKCNKKILEFKEGINKSREDFNLEDTKNLLKQSNITVNEKTEDSLELFTRLWSNLVNGASTYEIYIEFKNIFDAEEMVFSEDKIKKVFAPYVIHNLVEIRINKQDTIRGGFKLEIPNERFYLTDFGMQFVKSIIKGVTSIEI